MSDQCVFDSSAGVGAVGISGISVVGDRDRDVSGNCYIYNYKHKHHHIYDPLFSISVVTKEDEHISIQ